MTIQFSITIEPLVILLLTLTVIGFYAIKRGYDWSRQQMEAKAKQGQHIY